ncbi:hypothetical protein JW906_15705 [bacterium]|nr:hypothetical protein [bacterium]
MKVFGRILLFILLAGAPCVRGDGRRISAGVSAGIGMPKLALSEYHSPLSILSGLMIHVSPPGPLDLQINGFGLTTFSLGKVHGTGDDPRFDLAAVTLDVMKSVGGAWTRSSFILAGAGKYRVRQNSGTETCTGLQLGLVSGSRVGAMNAFFEVRWHLLLHSGPDPQVLTLTLGLRL